MVTLRQDERGNYTARKRLPNDIRKEYGRLYGQRLEAKFFAPASTKRLDVERRFDESKSETNARIAAICAHRKGEDIQLTRHQARALAGEWYDWFLARHSAEDKNWEALRDKVQDAMARAVGEREWATSNPDDLWSRMKT